MARIKGDAQSIFFYRPSNRFSKVSGTNSFVSFVRLSTRRHTRLSPLGTLDPPECHQAGIHVGAKVLLILLRLFNLVGIGVGVGKVTLAQREKVTLIIPRRPTAIAIGTRVSRRSPSPSSQDRL